MTPECNTFREHFEPGLFTEHRSHCSNCRRFAEIVEAARAAGSRRPLPPRLSERLSKIALGAQPNQERAPFSLEPIPQLELPPGLEQRLSSIARRQAPPRWLRSPAASLAASLLFTVFVGSLVENPAAGVQRLADHLERRRDAVAATQLPSWHPPSLQQAFEPTETALRRTLEGAQKTLTRWVERLESSLPAADPDSVPPKPPSNES